MNDMKLNDQIYETFYVQVDFFGLKVVQEESSWILQHQKGSLSG